VDGVRDGFVRIGGAARFQREVEKEIRMQKLSGLMSGSWLFGALAAAVGTGCAQTHPLEGLNCPCAAGFSCRLDDNTCVATQTITPGNAPPRCTRTAPECTQSEHLITDHFASVDAAKAAATGRWLMCEGQVAPAVVVAPDFMGYEYRSDGRWSQLVKNAAGDCEAATGFNKEGTWSVKEMSGENAGMYQVTASTVGSGGGGEIFTLVASGQPRKLANLQFFFNVVADPQPQ
jgi:hypothetical protein